MSLQDDERDDYQFDVQFGEWLRQQRDHLQLSLEAAAQQAGMTAERLKGLELGYSQKGITHAESTRLCATYRLSLDEFLKKAIRG